MLIIEYTLVREYFFIGQQI